MSALPNAIRRETGHDSPSVSTCDSLEGVPDHNNVSPLLHSHISTPATGSNIKREPEADRSEHFAELQLQWETAAHDGLDGTTDLMEDSGLDEESSRLSSLFTSNSSEIRDFSEIDMDGMVDDNDSLREVFDLEKQENVSDVLHDSLGSFDNHDIIDDINVMPVENGLSDDDSLDDSLDDGLHQPELEEEV